MLAVVVVLSLWFHSLCTPFTVSLNPLNQWLLCEPLAHSFSNWILHTEYLCLCVILKAKDHFPKQHKLAGLRNGDSVFSGSLFKAVIFWCFANKLLHFIVFLLFHLSLHHESKSCLYLAGFFLTKAILTPYSKGLFWCFQAMYCLHLQGDYKAPTWIAFIHPEWR